MTFKTNKQAISPVVAVALLIVTAVSAVIGFQVWYSQYSSGIFVDVERDSVLNSGIEIDSLVGDTLYIRSSNTNLNVTDIKVGDITCNQSASLTEGINKINLDSSCLNTIQGVNEVFVQVEDGSISSKSFFFKDEVSSYKNEEPSQSEQFGPLELF